jgi:hypothetical protein
MRVLRARETSASPLAPILAIVFSCAAVFALLLCFAAEWRSVRPLYVSSAYEAIVTAVVDSRSGDPCMTARTDK